MPAPQLRQTQGRASAVRAAMLMSSAELKITAFTMACMLVAFSLDAQGSLALQRLLGVAAWCCLLRLLRCVDGATRLQVALAVTFASMGELFASVTLAAYWYRFDNVPAYVPPGHGMVYLSAVALARCELFTLYRRRITAFALALGILWAVWGALFAARSDFAGAILFLGFLIYLRVGRSPLVYVAAFFLTSYLELLGTYLEVWAWAVVQPITGLTQAIPPSGVAFWYCVVDSIALLGGPSTARAWRATRARMRPAPQR